MKIQILGSGCPTCQELHKLVKDIVAKETIDGVKSDEIEIEYLSGTQGVQKIMELGVMSSPVLVINDQVVATGMPSKEQIIAKIKQG